MNFPIYPLFRVGKRCDLAVLPLKTRSAIAIGKVAGPYQYTTDLGDGVRHVRKVEWLRTDLPRTAFGQDLLYSLGAFMTVCQIERNQAEDRIRAVLAGNADPGAPSGEEVEIEEGGERALDVEQAAGDQILEHIQRNFSGHKLATLVDAVLKAEGYLTRVSPPGPDGGVDILAGTGPMGFGTPRLCVQVKSSPSPSDVNVLRALQGVLQNFHAEQGLLVCWGGFKSSVIQEARQSFFTIRLWDSGDLLGMILKNHDKFADELKAELPLKRVWALVLEE
jgi:restriction system protein